MFRRWAVRFDDRCYLSLLDATCRRQVVCVIDGLWGGRLGTSLGCKAVSSWERVSTRSVGGGWSTGFAMSLGMVALGTAVSGIERAKKGKNEPRQTSWFIFGTHVMGLH